MGSENQTGWIKVFLEETFIHIWIIYGRSLHFQHLKNFNIQEVSSQRKGVHASGFSAALKAIKREQQQRSSVALTVKLNMQIEIIFPSQHSPKCVIPYVYYTHTLCFSFLWGRHAIPELWEASGLYLITLTLCIWILTSFTSCIKVQQIFTFVPFLMNCVKLLHVCCSDLGSVWCSDLGHDHLWRE